MRSMTACVSSEGFTTILQRLPRQSSKPPQFHEAAILRSAAQACIMRSMTAGVSSEGSFARSAAEMSTLSSSP